MATERIDELVAEIEKITDRRREALQLGQRRSARVAELQALCPHDVGVNMDYDLNLDYEIDDYWFTCRRCGAELFDAEPPLQGERLSQVKQWIAKQRLFRYTTGNPITEVPA